MEKKTIDECLTPKLRLQIEKLIDLNLNLESIWDLLQEEIDPYENYMRLEVKRFVKYLLWLRDNHKESSNAFEKYKRYTTDLNPNFRKEAPMVELEQKWKDQKRIDELSALMTHKLAKVNSSQNEEDETLSINPQMNNDKAQDFARDETANNSEDTNNILYHFNEAANDSDTEEKAPLLNVLIENERLEKEEKTWEATVDLEDEIGPRDEEETENWPDHHEDNSDDKEIDNPSKEEKRHNHHLDNWHKNYGMKEANDAFDKALDTIIDNLSDDEIEQTAQTLIKEETSLSNSLEQSDTLLFEDEEGFGETEEQSLSDSKDTKGESKDMSHFSESTLVMNHDTFDPFLEDNGTQTFNESIFEPTQIIEETTDSISIEPEPQVKVKESNSKPNDNPDASPVTVTTEALAFLKMMEAKYEGDKYEDTVMRKTTKFMNPEDFYNRLGDTIFYEGENYTIKRVEVILDFFKHPQTLVTLENQITSIERQVNVRKLLNKFQSQA